MNDQGQQIIWWRVVLVLAVAFAVASIAFAKLLSLLPDSSKLSPLVTLGVSLMIAWLLTAGLGTNIAPAKHALALATVCLLVAAPAVYVFRGQIAGPSVTPGGVQPGENAQAGEVLFKYEASFTYLGSEENLPLVECSVQFPCPTVDGEPVIKQENMRWQLWGPVTGENGASWLELEVDNNNAFQWVGARANSPPDNNFYWSPFGMPSHFISDGMTYWDNNITWKIGLELRSSDKVYAGEMLKSISYFSLPLENVAKMTLRENDGRVLGALFWRNGTLEVWDGSPDDLVLASNVSFSVQLSKQVDNNFETVTQFSKMAENMVSGYRYPISLLL